MGLFNKNKNKEYSLQEAKSLLGTRKFANYTAVEVQDTGLYRLIPEKEALNQAREIRKQEKASDRENFINRINVNKSYRDIGLPNYNNYQSRNIRKSYNDIDYTR